MIRCVGSLKTREKKRFAEEERLRDRFHSLIREIMSLSRGYTRDEATPCGVTECLKGLK